MINAKVCLVELHCTLCHLINLIDILLNCPIPYDPYAVRI